MEEVGNNYFDDLLSRSFFQFHKGKYTMQYAIHGLAQSVALDDCLRLEDLARGSNTARVNHLSFSCDNSKQTSFQDFYEFRGVRTLLLLRGSKSKTASPPNDLFNKLRYLRVLELHRRDISELPDSIGNLKQLRYLNLSGTGIRKLPSTISKLYNLQALKLRHCGELDEIPKGVTKLVNLRHLEASTRLITAIAKIGRLTNLQELEEYVVRRDNGFKISELKKMSELRGRLCITNLEEVNGKDESSEAMLGGKEYLTTLDLAWSENRSVTLKEEHLDEQVLESLQPHTRLKELTIKGFVGCKFPSWLDNPCGLHTIHLLDCKRCETLPPLGQLPSLKYLDIGGLDAVAEIGQEFSGNGAIEGFPSLKELVLDDMLNLKEWIYQEKDEFLPCLTDLEVRNCPVLRELPRLPPTLERIWISETGIHALPTMHASSSSSLSSLQIHECAQLKSLKQGLLTQQLSALKNVTITDCEELVSLPEEGFRSLTSLASLHIYNCPKLAPLAKHKGGTLPGSLEDLQIRSCSKLINSLLPELKNLPFLAHLTIANCNDLLFFPEQGLPIALEILGISHCKNLQHLPDYLSELSSLKTLSILSCPQIPYLPLSGLPASLRELYIKDCPMLTARCQQNAGADWPKISHIPNIQVREEGFLPEMTARRRR
uniref:Uncharacterized protein n=1 Tax=Ananas comosus var. bracteatus TaxID=296719 RepID=A0A6V7PFA1_ANACO|nr:unnamed protein product [Ananas comosus var. bracteatus]